MESETNKNRPHALSLYHRPHPMLPLYCLIKLSHTHNSYIIGTTSLKLRPFKFKEEISLNSGFPKRLKAGVSNQEVLLVPELCL